MLNLSERFKNFIGSLANRWLGRLYPTNKYVYYTEQLPGTDIDFQSLAGRLDLHLVVQSQVGWLAEQFCQAKFEVYEIDKDGYENPIWNHPIHGFLKLNSRNETPKDLWVNALYDYCIHGNAYWHILLSATGKMVGLEHVPAFRVTPWWPVNSDEWLTHYLIDVDGNQVAKPKEEIIHFKDRKDPCNERLGISRLRAAYPQLCGLNEATVYAYSLLKNSGKTGMIVSPASTEVEWAPGKAEELKRKIDARGGDGRFEPIVSDIPVKIDHTSFSPEHVGLETTPAALQADICACIGVPPMVTGLSASRYHSTYANAAEAKKAAWERLAAIQDRFADIVESQLLPLVDPLAFEKNLKCRFNRNDIDALNESRATLVDEAVKLFANKIAKLNEARERVGLDRDPQGDVYFEQETNSNPSTFGFNPNHASQGEAA